MKFKEIIKLFKKTNIAEYYTNNHLDKIIGIKYKLKKNDLNPNYIFDNNNKIQYEPDIKDLVRLHFFIKMRNITTILEFGVGYSTLVMADALNLNKSRIKKNKINKIRRGNLFELHTVDTDKKYISITKKKNRYNEIVKFNYSEAIMIEFNHKPCAKFKKLPNITPDFIYIDGPCYMHVKGTINGINMRHKDRTLVSTDLLNIEHLLVPGTVVLWDGQKNNVNFFKKNTIRNWDIYEDKDIFIAELNEKSLGVYNDNHLELLNG